MNINDIQERNYKANQVRQQFKGPNWSIDKMVEIILDDPENFLKIKETLTRIGVASRTDMKIYQSAHILHKQGKYYIVHFKELFALDGKHADITTDDLSRRNAIIKLLVEWKLLRVHIRDTNKLEPLGNLSMFKIISYKEKKDWKLCPKYNIGKRY